MIIPWIAHGVQASGGPGMSELSLWEWIGHILAPAAIIGTILAWFPYFAAFLAVVWYLVQLYESKTIQDAIKAHRLRKYAKLKAQMLILEELLKQTERDANAEKEKK